MVSKLKVKLNSGTNFTLDLTSLDCRLRMLENFFLSHFLKKNLFLIFSLV